MTTTLTFQWSEGPSATVVAAVADELGTDPDELDAPLHDFIEPDALDVLFAPTHGGVVRANGRVTFSMHDCSVTVDSCGEVTAKQEVTPAATQGQTDESRTFG